MLFVRDLPPYDDFYWTICIGSSCLWEERLGGEGLNYEDERELKHQYFDFPCYKLYRKELASNKH